MRRQRKLVNRLSAAERSRRAQELGITIDPEDEWLLHSFTWADAVDSIRTTVWDIATQRQQHAALHHCIVGQPINGMDVDHIDRNIRNNCKSNLRYISHSANGVNSTRVEMAAHITETPYGRFQLRIARNGMRHHIGNYATYDAAMEARDSWLSKQET